jgi:ADP-dependent phosphofructokinase/glucokinase
MNEVIRGLFLLESQLASEIKEKVVGYGALCYNMHGNQHQAGIPDLLICTRKGSLALYELKIDRRKKHHPFQAFSDFENFLEGAQVGVIKNLLARKAKAGVVIYDSQYSMRNGKGHIVHVYAPHLSGTPIHIDVGSFAALACADMQL